MDASELRPIVELERVSRVYRTGRVEVGALRDVSVTIADGELVAIVGRSASGPHVGDGGGAGDGDRTRDIQLGRLTLCQLSYSRPEFASFVLR